MKKKIYNYLYNIINRITASSFGKIETKIDNLIQQNQNLIEKNNLLIKKADRIIGHKTLYIKEGLSVVRLIDGSKIYINPEDQDVGSYVALHGFWEPHIEEIWRKLVKDGDVIFDVGANFGYFSAVAARKMKKGHIYLFEANNKLISYLEKTMSINGFANKSSIVNKAVGDKKGVQKFRESQNFWGRSTLTESSIGEKGKLKKVEVITLDQYCAENKITNIDLIKMDIEGYEDRAYIGMNKIINDNKHVKIVMEFSANHYKNAEDFYRKIKKDFKNIYIFHAGGKLMHCLDYQDINKNKVGSNTMILLSNEILV